ncbi:hypothetical protein POM88_006146 [Heracleum sosnowskyi]|uniref:Homeobox domain-containing protein n=1 Tax=Heracleum sosnowskyi TaxID=360622 RepID=A0AAD8J4B4_9APIA|nr:hypothetical protein POM88_006146 [Heracleum sosnowskyi]
MEMQGDHGFGNNRTFNGDIQEFRGDKFMHFSADQVKVLEEVFVECQKPGHDMRIAMIRENSVLSNLNSQQIQAWFENRRFLEKKKKDTFVFNLVNEKMAAIGKMLLLENDFLHGEVQQLLREKEYICELLQYASVESFLAEVPRSVFNNVKMVATRRLLLLQNEYLHIVVEQLHMEKEFFRNLQENRSNSESILNSCLSWSASSRSSKGLPLLSGTIAKLPLKTSSELICVSIPRMKFPGGLKEITVITCSDLTYFSPNVDVPDVLSFVKAAMVPHGPLDFLRKDQEFILCCSLKDVKLVLQGSLESPTAVVPAFLPQSFRVVVGRYRVSGAWSYIPNEQAAPRHVKFVLRFNSSMQNSLQVESILSGFKFEVNRLHECRGRLPIETYQISFYYNKLCSLSKAFQNLTISYNRSTICNFSRGNTVLHDLVSIILESKNAISFHPVDLTPIGDQLADFVALIYYASLQYSVSSSQVFSSQYFYFDKEKFQQPQQWKVLFESFDCNETLGVREIFILQGASPSSWKSSVYISFDFLQERVNRLLTHPHWLPIQRCQICFYSQKLSFLSIQLQTRISMDENYDYELHDKKSLTHLGSEILLSKDLATFDPRDLARVGKRLALEVAGIYNSLMHDSPNFTSQFYFDKNKFQEY